MALEDLSKLRIDKAAAAERPPKKGRVLRWTAAVLAIVFSGYLYSAGVLTPSVEVEAVNVLQMYPSQNFTVLNASGYMVAQRKAAVASKVTGRLVSLTVEEGVRVKKGEVIALLESEDLMASRDLAAANLNSSRSALEEATAELGNADISFRRSRELVEKGYVSRTDFDAAQTRLEKTKAAVAAAKAAVKAYTAALKGAEVSLEYASIRAPFDSVVLTKNADIGDIVTPLGAAANAKASVVTIADLDSLQVEVDVAESNIGLVNKGQPCEVQLDSLPDKRFRGEVHMIVPTADRTKATVLVKVRILDKDPGILPEMSARVAFLSRPVGQEEKKPYTAVNAAAIREKAGKKFVYLIKSDRAEETMVTVGQKHEEMIEVISGVKPGDKVVLKPLDRIKPGARIKLPEG